MVSALLRWLGYLSADTVGGTVGCSLWAAHLTGAEVPGAWWPVFGAGVWAIYTIDRLVDVKCHDTHEQHRHRIHRDYARILWPLALAAGVGASIGAVVVLGRAAAGVMFGLGLIALMHIGMMRNAPYRGIKELVVASVYTAGIWGVPLVYAGRLSWGIWLAIMALWGAVMLNLALCSYIEEDVASPWRRVSRKQIIAIGVGVVGSAIACGWVLKSPEVPIIIGIIVGVHGGLMVENRWTREWCHEIGEWAFLVPIVAVIGFF